MCDPESALSAIGARFIAFSRLSEDRNGHGDWIRPRAVVTRAMALGPRGDLVETPAARSIGQKPDGTAYCKFTGITTYTKSVPLLINPGLFPALSSMITSGSAITFSASVIKLGLKPISMSVPS